MELEEYKITFEVEEGHWFFKGLRSLVFSSIPKFFPGNKKIKILDAGCGTGFLLKCLNNYGTAFGVDISDVALEYCQMRGLNRITRGSILELPFSDGTFDLVISTDVLYHKKVPDDKLAINEIHRVLKKDGILIINLAAHEYLKRKHDDRVHTRHRYTRGELIRKLQGVGFKIIKISYHNAFSFIILSLLKLLDHNCQKQINTGLKFMCWPVNALFCSTLRVENLLLKFTDIPIGTSIFCISQKLIDYSLVSEFEERVKKCESF